MGRGLRVVATALVSLALASGAALAQSRAKLRDLTPGAEKRVALVVGNSRYRYIPALDNPVNDAKLMAETLRALGFTLIGGGAQLDLDKAGFDRAVQSFGELLAQGADVALFYYAGHGLQVRGNNYLVPVSANPQREAEIDFQMMDANLVLRQMEGAGTKLNLMILDARRNNPFGGRGLRTSGGGLAQMQAPEGTLISYATQPGNVAMDGTDGDSPFTKALAQTLRRPGLDVFQAFNEVGLNVKRVTGGSQQPWVSNSPIDGAFYFAGAPSGGPIASAPPAQLAPTPAPGVDPVVVELAFWDSIKGSTNRADFEEYLRQYPQGRFAGLAQNRIRSAPVVEKSDVLDITGTWHWAVSSFLIFGFDVIVTVRADGTCTGSGGGTCKWTLKQGAENRVALYWDNGFVDSMTLSKDALSMSGTNNWGTSITGKKIIEAENSTLDDGNGRSKSHRDVQDEPQRQKNR